MMAKLSWFAFFLSLAITTQAATPIPGIIPLSVTGFLDG